MIDPFEEVAGLSAPARRALAGANIRSWEDLTGVTEPFLAELHGMGPKGIRVLRQALADRRLTFARED